MKPRDAHSALAQANPVRDADAAHLPLTDAEEAMLTTILESGPSEQARPGPVVGRRTRRRILALAGAVALFAAIAGALLLDSGPTAQPAVADVLRQAADVAATQPNEPRPGPGQYYYTRSREAYLSTVAYSPHCQPRPTRPCEATKQWSVMSPRIRQTWIGANGAGRARVLYAKPEFLTAGQRRAWKAAGSPHLSSGQVEDFALTGQPFLDTSGLPTEPSALRKLIEAREIPLVNGPPGEAETFTLIGDMLRNTYLPSSFRASLYRVAAELPNVELRGEVKDPVGRAGIGVAFTKGGSTHELIFDPATAALLGEREVAAHRIPALHVPAGTETGSTAYLESKVVNSLGRGAPPDAGHLRQSIGCYETASRQANTTVVHGADPIATCENYWREGVVDSKLRLLEREGKIAERPDKIPDLVACVGDYPAVTYVLPGDGPSVCARLGWRPASP